MLSIIEIISLSISGIISITMAFMDYGVYALVWQRILYSLFSAILLWYLSKWKPKIIFSFSSIKKLWKFSSNLVGSQFFLYWIRNGDNLLIGKFVGAYGLGIYHRAYTTMLLPVTQINQILTRVMFPALSKIQDDKKRFRIVYLNTIGAISVISFPLMIGLFVASKEFVLTLFGPNWIEVYPILQIFCWVGLAQSITTTTGWIFTSTGRTDIQFKWVIFASIATFTAFAVGDYG